MVVPPAPGAAPAPSLDIDSQIDAGKLASSSWEVVLVSNMKISLFPIERIARDWLGSTSNDNFDDTLLPFQVLDDVYVENISGKISDDEFDYCKRELGTETIKHLENVEYAIVHRFPRIANDPATGDLIFETELEDRSTRLVQEVIACLRLIRPIAQHAQFWAAR
jgi:hypothetical protein